MNTVQPISLFSFLRSPLKGLPRLNGWQRIWLALSTIIFALHAVIGAVSISNSSSADFDPASFRSKLELADQWQPDKNKCKAAGKELEAGKSLNDEYNAKGLAQAEVARAATQIKIEQAKARLFEIETTGGKYYPEWSKYDNAIQAYTAKLREQQWKPRDFEANSGVYLEALKTLQLCELGEGARTAVLAEIDTAKQAAEYAKATRTNVLLGTALSFLCFVFGLYLVGWCIGWIAGGFRRRTP